MPAWSKLTKKFAALGLVPRTRLARFTGYLAVLELLLLGLQKLLAVAGKPGAAGSLGGWTTFLGMVVLVLFAFVGSRWFRSHVMWSVRNRLIVTYLFIGGVPLILVLLIVSIAGFFLTSQFASYLTVSDMQAQLKRLQAANSAAAQLISKRSARKGTTTVESFEPSDVVLPEGNIQLLTESARPKWLKNGFNSLVTEQGKPYLRAASVLQLPRQTVTIISSVPLDEAFLARIAADLGPITFYIPRPDAEGNINVNVKANKVLIQGDPGVAMTAGSLPPASHSWDRKFDYYAILQSVDWKNGNATPTLLTGTARLSALYSRLSSGAVSQWAYVLVLALTALAAIFGIMVLVAWFIGIRLTRTVTYSVSNLYKATQHINRGDFNHRIQVKEHDQLAALQTAFNSMTDSLQRLILEQKEKERLQSELEIAHEVQAQLFPRDFAANSMLELHGTCRPAMTVSGDYYDFLSYGPGQVGIAVGDISGKGISAALLMATIHSAVRAYEQEQLMALEAAANYGTESRSATLTLRTASSPAQMLWVLNRHLYRSTQPEKYATMFLGSYDDSTHRFTYSNAGHLPPMVLGQDGSVRRLETGGTVVGLFESCEYQEETIEFHRGDIFIAFSDGMTEPENEFGEFGEERLIETISAYRRLPLEKIAEHTVAAVRDWIGPIEQPDDMTLVLARRP